MLTITGVSPFLGVSSLPSGMPDVNAVISLARE